MDISFNKTEGEIVQFDTQDGIEIGNMPDGGLNVNVDFFCTNATVTDPELTLSLNLDVKANIDAGWDQFVITGAINEVLVSNTQVTYTAITLDYHNYDTLFSAVAETMADDFNIVHSKGINLIEKYPTAGFINGLARNTIVSPTVQEEFIYAGFKWISDMGSEMTKQYEFAQ